jgi:hypothetical protein
MFEVNGIIIGLIKQALKILRAQLKNIFYRIQLLISTS